MLATDSLSGEAAPAAAVPRPVLWLALVASAVAMLAIGIVTTAVVLGRAEPRLSSVPVFFAGAVAVGLAATCMSLAVRTVRWVFLLRRANVRIPLRDACIGYLSGLVFVVVPLLIGEIVTRAAVHKSRAGVPVASTSVINLWERMLDVAALAVVTGVAAGVFAGPAAAIFPLTIVAATATRSFRAFGLAVFVRASNAVVRRVSANEIEVPAAEFHRLISHATWLAALAASVAAWMLPAVALWTIAGAWGPGVSLAKAQFAYASSTLAGALLLAPGGIRIVGQSLLAYLTGTGLTEPQAALTVLAVRLVTAGFATVLGAMFFWAHWRTRPLTSASHFDDIAHAYDAQIPAAQRESLLTRKTTLMRDVLREYRAGRRGLDVGCGQGWYVARMRRFGFDVHGIDTSAGQIALARRHVDEPQVLAEGSVLRIPAADASFDFAYCINVLHHLGSEGEQRAAFAELFRVLRPGGLLFVHEINTRNVLFRFYMGYVFPSLNCIDEGTERWLLPHRLRTYTDAPVLRTEYFTFMPEFAPRFVLRMFRPLETLLEASPLRVYSAHYMAVLQKPASNL